MFIQQPTEHQQLAVEVFRKFLDSEIRPVAQRFRDRRIPKDRMRELTQAIAEFGLPGASVPAEFGGAAATRCSCTAATAWRGASRSSAWRARPS
jgi:alkylation response protein AidB-like acyl-CoA dehydrogenase